MRATSVTFGRDSLICILQSYAPHRSDTKSIIHSYQTYRHKGKVLYVPVSSWLVASCISKQTEQSRAEQIVPWLDWSIDSYVHFSFICEVFSHTYRFCIIICGARTLCGKWFSFHRNGRYTVFWDYLFLKWSSFLSNYKLLDQHQQLTCHFFFAQRV